MQRRYRLHTHLPAIAFTKCRIGIPFQHEPRDFKLRYIVSRDAWSSLTDEQRGMIEEINVDAYELQFAALADADTAWIPQFDQSGLTRVIYDDDVLARFRGRDGTASWDDWVQRNQRRFPCPRVS